MNKKLYIILVLALILIPLAAAQITEGIKDTLGLIFDATGDIAYIKAITWLIPFFLISRAVIKVFPQNRGAAAILAAVISLIGVRYMPEEYFDFLTKYYAILAILIFFYFVGKIFRKGATSKTFIAVLLLTCLAYFLAEWGYLPAEGASGVLNAAFDWAGEHNFIMFVAIGILCLYLILRKEEEEGAGTLSKTFGKIIIIAAAFLLAFYFPDYMVPILVIGAIIFILYSLFRPHGASLREGLYKGAREAEALARLGAGKVGDLAKQHTMAGASWIQRKKAEKKARAIQRARLKAGWKQAEAKYKQQILQMPKGNYIAKGTPGYELLRQRQIRLAKIRERLGKKPGFKI